ncbi:MAG: TonB-dependent receptor [Sphingobacteriaceae bacterium]|nr:MAG: TonB-dependent receptor [Sphingobacteriaceae bacterium]
MKKNLLLLVAFVLFRFVVSAQSNPGKIKGIVQDSVKKTPLGYVTIVLKDAADKAVKSTLTADNGSFEILNLKPGAYKVNIAYIGYSAKIIPVKEASGTVDLGTIKLSASSNQLKEVSVVAARPILKREVDRIAYDVQADPESTVLTALDMLRKVPMLSVDAQDNIKLKGSGNYKILINNKESSLVAKNPSDVFKAMPASNIEKIEVITTPPAKYDAEGLAGIINITTKKNADQGYNGSINVRENVIYGPGVNVNATLKKGKFGASGYAGIGDQTARTNPYDNLQTFTKDNSTLTQNGTNTNGGYYSYGSVELSYEIDTLNLLTSSIEVNKGRFKQGSDQVTAQRSSLGDVAQMYHLTNNGVGYWNGIDLALNYQLGFKKDKNRLLTLSYKFSHSPNRQFNDVSLADVVNYQQPNYQQYNTAGSNTQTFQLDYVYPVKKLNIEAGGKAILRDNFSDFRSENLNNTTGLYEINPTQTNDFTYQQNVYSVYNSYQLKLAKWTAKGGLRLEHTSINADFTSVGSVAAQDYNNLIPSVSLQRSFKTSSINLGFTQRIQRPGIWQLNPFVDLSNTKFISTGNPNLKPELNNTFELTYSNFSKGSVNFGLNYAFSNNSIQNVANLTVLPNAAGQQDTVTLSTYQNVGTNKSIGLNTSANFTFFKKLNFSLNAELRQIFLEGSYNGDLYKNSGITGNASLNLGYKLDSGYRLGFDSGYYSGDVLLQGKTSYFAYSSYSASKELFKKKFTISSFISNPYSKFFISNQSNNTPDYNQLAHYYRRNRHFGISLNYKFGKLEGSIKKNARGINNDDTKSGGKSGASN